MLALSKRLSFTFRRSTPALGLAVLMALSMTGAAAAAVENYKIDRNHSSIGYTIRHVVSNFQGTFPKFKGTISFDPANYKTTTVDVTIWANAISSGNPGRDKHLMSDAFFNAAIDSLITFKSTSVTPTDKDNGTMVGDLTMRGVTKPVTLKYTVLGFFTDGEGHKKSGFEATGVVNRKDFGVNWNNELAPGNLMLGDEVKLNLQIEANLMPPEGAAPPPAKP